MVLAFIFFVSIVISQTVSDDQTDEQYERIQNLTEKIPLDESGEIDEERINKSYVFLSSKAEERINKINEWLEENASWLRFFFRMIPELSWLFFWNLYFIILALTYLVFNARATWFFIESETMGRVFGIALFFILLLTNVFLSLAHFIVNAIYLFLTYVLPWGTIIALILTIVFFIVCFFFWPVVLSVLQFVAPKLLRYFGVKVATNAFEELENKVDELKEK